MIQTTLEWLFANWLELVGVLSGLLFLYFEYKESSWMWVTGILTSLLYTIIFFKSRFYADMGLQIYYVVIGFYGLYRWNKPQSSEKEASIGNIPNKELVYVFVTSILLWCGLYFLLSKFTDSPVPLGDAFTSAFGITATWMLTHKYIQQWLFWIIINAVSMGLYLSRGLDLTAFLYFVYGAISVAGYYKWRQKM